MAKHVPIDQANHFMLKMDTEDMHKLTELSQRSKTNYPDTVLACFHCGLVKMSTHKHGEDLDGPLANRCRHGGNA